MAIRSGGPSTLLCVAVASALATGPSLSTGCGAGHERSADTRVEGDRAGPAAVGPPMASRLIGEPANDRPARPVEVELIDPGREPRRLLRYEAVGGTRQRIDRRMNTVSHLLIGGRPWFSQDGPNLDASLEIEVVAAEPDRLDCELRVERAEDVSWRGFESGRRHERRISRERLKSFVYRFSMDRRGFVRAPIVALSRELDRDEDRDVTGRVVEDTVRSIAMLPAEPVGVGARWRYVEDHRIGLDELNLYGHTATEVEVRSMSGRRIDLATSHGFVLPAQVLLHRAGSVLGMSSGRSSWRGRAGLDLGFPHPLSWARKGDGQFDGDNVELADSFSLRVQVAVSESVTLR